MDTNFVPDNTLSNSEIADIYEKHFNLSNVLTPSEIHAIHESTKILNDEQFYMLWRRIGAKNVENALAFHKLGVNRLIEIMSSEEYDNKRKRGLI